MPRRRSRDKLGTSQGHLGHLGLIYVEINTKGTECPRDRRDISRDRWDVSPGQTGRTPGGVPAKFFMFIVFFFPHYFAAPHCLPPSVPKFHFQGSSLGSSLGPSWRCKNGCKFAPVLAPEHV